MSDSERSDASDESFHGSEVSNSSQTLFYEYTHAALCRADLFMHDCRVEANTAMVYGLSAGFEGPVEFTVMQDGLFCRV